MTEGEAFVRWVLTHGWKITLACSLMSGTAALACFQINHPAGPFNLAMCFVNFFFTGLLLYLRAKMLK